MIVGVSICQEDDLQIKQPKFLADQKIFHQPPKVLFNSRAFDLEVFTEYDKKQVKQVSLFFRTDSQPRYREVAFSKDADRYSFRYDPLANPANYITYFFTVELNNGSVFATPVDSSGLLKPVTMNLVDPMQYYKERAEGKF